jgi:hypothetical protein
MGEKWPVNLACDFDFHVNQRVLLHTANVLQRAGGFTSPPKEGMRWIFSSASAGFEHVILGTRGQHANLKINEAAETRRSCRFFLLNYQNMYLLAYCTYRIHVKMHGIRVEIK